MTPFVKKFIVAYTAAGSLLTVSGLLADPGDAPSAPAGRLIIYPPSVQVDAPNDVEHVVVVHERADGLSRDVTTEVQWISFCEAINRREWLDDPRFATLHVRKQNEDELDRLIEAWTIGCPAADVMRILQAVRVPAGRVADARDLSEDPQLAARDHSMQIQHAEIGLHTVESPSFRLSRTPPQKLRAAPLLGEHTEQVFREILGLSASEYADLESDGVFV